MTKHMETCVQSTTDYKKFKILLGNRKISERHIASLILSFKIKNIPVPVVVNEKFEVIDGQHRVGVCKTLGIPISYIVIPGLTIDDVHLLNSNQSNWKDEDLANQYSARYIAGESIYADYKRVADFQKKTNLPLGKAIILLGNGKKVGSETIRKGAYVITSTMDRAEELADNMAELGKEIGSTRTNSTNFWNAYVLVLRIEGVSHENMLRKLKRFGSELDGTKNTVFGYADFFDEIFNYKLMDKNQMPVSFEVKRLFKSKSL